MYRRALKEQGRESFREILEEAWTWDRELAGRASYPAWPYVGPGYGESPRVLVVGKAHEQWPSTSVGLESREPPHLESVGADGSLLGFKERFDLEDIDEAIEHLTTLNDDFIKEVKSGGYPSSFWSFTRELLDEMGLGFDEFAWTNTFPFCKAPRGLPGTQLRRVQEGSRSFVGETAKIIDAEYVLITGSSDWQHHAKAAIQGEWDTFPAPIDAGRKSKTWARCRLPSGGLAIRSWHPQGSPRGFLEALTKSMATPGTN